MSDPKKIPTDGGQSLGQNPFASLDVNRLPPSALPPLAFNRLSPLAQSGSPSPPKNRGRVDILRETGGRAGKTVTVVTGFIGIGQPEKERLAKQMRAACGCGGTVKDGRIEIQGDQREMVAKILIEAGFRPVFAGG